LLSCSLTLFAPRPRHAPCPLVPHPHSTANFKIGFEKNYDNYTALEGRSDYGGAATRGAGQGVNATEARLLADASTLRHWLATRAVRRLFVVGIATDYVVKNTVLAALAERGRQLPALEDIVVLQSGIRGKLKPRTKERERERERERESTPPTVVLGLRERKPAPAVLHRYA
jgi:hypothetical protein